MTLRRLAEIDQLAAFVIANADCRVETAALHRALGECLPPYMVPAHFEMVPRLPRLTSGKVDRKALADWTLNGAGRGWQRRPLH